MNPVKRLLMFVLLPLLTACGSEGTGAQGPSWFRASLSGEVAGEYEGTGDFAFERDHGDSPVYFRISSAGLDPAVQEAFGIRWPDGRRPSPGTYALVPHTDLHGSSNGVAAVYRWSRGDNVSAPHEGETYVAVGGTVEITRSTDDEVDGTIHFSGILVDRTTPQGLERRDPRDRPDPAAPRIEVTGTFRLTRFDGDNVVVRNGG